MIWVIMVCFVCGVLSVSWYLWLIVLGVVVGLKNSFVMLMLVLFSVCVYFWFCFRSGLVGLVEIRVGGYFVFMYFGSVV